jgi:hypothetical protein
MHVLQVISHSPESCPIGNPKNLEIKMNWLQSIESSAAKYGIHVLGVWTDRWGHTSWAVFETASMDAFKQFELEPENMARVTFTQTQTIMVTSAKETLAFFNEIKK